MYTLDYSQILNTGGRRRRRGWHGMLKQETNILSVDINLRPKGGEFSERGKDRLQTQARLARVA